MVVELLGFVEVVVCARRTAAASSARARDCARPADTGSLPSNGGGYNTTLWSCSMIETY